jgi:hypothetical protein
MENLSPDAPATKSSTVSQFRFQCSYNSLCNTLRLFSSVIYAVYLRHCIIIMRTENARKRKETAEQPEVVFSSGSDDGDRRKQRKARRVSADAAVSTATSLQVDTPVVTDKSTIANTASATTAEGDTPVVTEENTAANTASAATDKHVESIQVIGKMIRDMSHSDNSKVNDTLAALSQDLAKDKKKCDKIQAVGGCLALVQLVEKCLDKAIVRIPACDQVTGLNELTELWTLHKTLNVIIGVTFQHDESKVGIAAVGGVEAVVKVMKTFPKCQFLQAITCGVLANLAYNNVTGTKNAVESGGIELLLAAINNHLVSALVCEKALRALVNLVVRSKENTRLLISLGGGAAVDKVGSKWPNNDNVQIQVRKLANSFALEWRARADK